MKKINRIPLVLYFVLFTATIFAQSYSHESGGIEFIENKNQWDNKILYKSDISCGAVFLEKAGITFLFKDITDLNKIHKLKHNDAKNQNNPELSDITIRCHAYKMNFLNSNKETNVTGSDPNKGYFNYFIGNEKEHWASHVKSYKTVNYKNLYDKTDLTIYRNKENLKYDIILHPGAQSDKIRFQYEGAEKTSLSNGNLIIKTSVNEITELSPEAYQTKGTERVKIPCLFNLKNDILSFEFPSGYDATKDLIIDPVLVFSTYTGSYTDNWGFTATFDSLGDGYSGGIAFGSGYPVNTGPFQVSFGGGDCDVAIIKYDPTGSQRLWASYLGGSGSELPHSMIVNNADELLVFGTTGSTNFPVTAGAFDQSFNGGSLLTYDGISFFQGSDIFISKISSDGSQLLASTYVGGSQNDGLNYPSSLYFNYADGARGEIMTDNANNVYIGSTTNSSDFPVTSGSFQQTSLGGQEGVVFKMDPNLTTQLWSSYLGGNASDAIYGICVDPTNTVYVTGGTNSQDFPTTAGVLYPTFMGGSIDGFITKISPDGSSIVKSTYYGSSSYDQSYFINNDNAGNVVIFGQTEAPGNTFIYNAAWAKPNGGQFISKITPDLSSLVWSTTFGNANGTPDISPTAFLVDICNYVYLSGWGGPDINSFGGTAGLPITANAYQSTTDNNDFYFLVINSDASSLIYATYFGSPDSPDHVDGGTSRFDKNGKIYQSVCAGCGGDDNFPTTPGAWSQVNNSTNCNNALIKFNFELNKVKSDANIAPNDTGCVPLAVNFINNSNAVDYVWNFGDGTGSNLVSPSHTFNVAGNYTVSLIAIDSLKCNIADTAYLTLKVINVPVVNLGPDQKICTGQNVPLNAGNPGKSFLWSTGATTQMITAVDSGLIWVKVTDGPCFSSDTVSIHITKDITYKIPNVFTPNDDLLNDVFKVESQSEITEFKCTVFNRWGNKVFEWTDATQGWNGKIGNADAAEGVYYYILTFKNQCGAVENHGTVTLMK